MSVLSDIVDRLNAYAPIFAGRVSVARSINNPEPTALPEAWVHKWTKIATPNQTTNFTVQAITCEISILIACENETADGVDHQDAVELEVLAALVDVDFLVGLNNWPLEYARLEFVENIDTHQTFRMTFRYQEYVRG